MLIVVIIASILAYVIYSQFNKKSSRPQYRKGENWFTRGPQFDHVDDFFLNLQVWAAWLLWRLMRLTFLMLILSFILAVLNNLFFPKKPKTPSTIQTPQSIQRYPNSQN